MNKTLEDLKSRRSVRKYKPDMVKKADLDAVLEAGTWAPTAKNGQRACIVAVTDKATRDQLSRMNAEALGARHDPFYGAPVVCVVFGDSTWPNGERDGSLILGNMMLAAHALGLGSCWINRADAMFATEEGKALMAKWGVPEGYTGVGNCILGYPDQDPAPKPRQEGIVIRVE